MTAAVPESTLDTAAVGIRQLARYVSHEGLTIMGADGRPTPNLAREWRWLNNGLRLEIALKEGVRAHDGTTLTAEVAAQALENMVSRPGNRLLYPAFADVRSVKPVGEFDLAIDLARPSALLPEALSLPFGVGPQDTGTGPYRIVESTSDAITLERFDDYHLGRPAIQRVVIRSFPALRTAWASLLRGEVDMVTNVPPDAMEFVSTNAVRTISYPRSYQFLVAFNSRRPVFRSPQVRRALNLAIDRDGLVDRVLRGTGTPSSGPIWPQHWAYDRSVGEYSFDPVQASALLNAEGLRARSNPDGGNERFRFTCLIPAGFSLVEKVALDVQKQLYNIGVDMQFESVPIQEFDSRVREGRFDAMLIDVISAPGFSHSQLFWRSARSIQGLNVFGYENAEAERLFTVLSETLSEAAIRSATSRLQRVLSEDPPALFLAWTEGSRVVDRRFSVIEEPGRDPLYSIWRWTPGDYEVQ